MAERQLKHYHDDINARVPPRLRYVNARELYLFDFAFLPHVNTASVFSSLKILGTLLLLLFPSSGVCEVCFLILTGHNRIFYSELCWYLHWTQYLFSTCVVVCLYVSNIFTCHTFNTFVSVCIVLIAR